MGDFGARQAWRMKLWRRNNSVSRNANLRRKIGKEHRSGLISASLEESPLAEIRCKIYSAISP